MKFDAYKAGDLGLVVEAGTDPKEVPGLQKGLKWQPVSNGQNLSTLKGLILAPSDREAEAQIKKQGYCMVKWPGQRILKTAP